MQNINMQKQKQQENEKQKELKDEWEQQEVDSEAQITLVKFNSNFGSQGQVRGSINSILQEYSIQERKNLIIDRTNGKIIDLRTDQIQDIPKRVSSKISNDANSFWDDHWEESQKIHQKLLMAICQKNSQLLQDLFNKKVNHIPINVNYKSFDNWTPLHFASMHGNCQAIEILLNSPQIFVNALTNFKWSSLHVAAKNNKFDAVSILMKAKINANYQDQDGYTALHYAIECGYNQLTKLLIDYGTDLKLKTNRGYTPENLCRSHDLLKLFKDENENGFLQNLAKNNKHVEKLFINLNILKKQEINKKIKKAEELVPLERRESSRNIKVKKYQSRRDNIVKMYQLLKEKKQQQIHIGLSSFKFYRKIGEGAFGEVYVVKKGKSQKLYALKAIKKQKIFGTNLYRYIQTQKEVLSLISHPFIVRLHYAFQTQSYLFLVMQYCQGGDLGKMLQKNKKFDEQVVKKYAAQILLGIEALHKQKIIYRDMKPQNIVLDSNGHALLTDFGLSKKTNSLDDINKSFCGTPAYLPLEIINKKGHTRMVDWYEYGVVLYQLYCGIPPFYAQTRTQLYQNVKAGIIRFPRGTPELFRDIIKKLLSQKPQKRLGFENDAQSIKQHPWFHDINWEQVYNKKLEMPKISRTLPFTETIKTKFIDTKSSKYLISNWTFIGQ